MKNKSILFVLFSFLSVASVAMPVDNESLPDAVFIPGGVATLKVSLEGYDSQNPASLIFSDIEIPTLSEEFNLQVPFDSDGVAVARIPLSLPQMLPVNIAGVCRPFVILAPGEEVGINVRLDEGKGQITRFDGFMKDTNSQLQSLDFDPDYQARQLIAKLDSCSSRDEILTLLHADLLAKKEMADSLPVTDAVKALLRMNAEDEFFGWNLNYGVHLIGRASYLGMMEIPPVEEYDRLLQHYDSIMPRNPQLDSITHGRYFELLAAPYAPVYSPFWYKAKPMADYIGSDGKPNRTNRDLLDMYAVVNERRGFDMNSLIDDIQDPGVRALAVESLTQRRLKAIELSQIPGVYCRTYDDLPDDQFLSAILSNYKGKYVFLDIWATWCGPCLKGHKEMEPLKKDLAGQDIVFVNLTSPASDLAQWALDIPAISGDHYFVSDRQMDYLLEQLQSQGFPTYVIYDKNGKQIGNRQVGYPGLESIKNKIDSAFNQ